MSFNIKIRVFMLILTGALLPICGGKLLMALGEQTADNKAKTATAKEGYSKGERLRDDRMSTRRLHPPEEKKKSKPKLIAPAPAKHDLKKSN